MGSVEGNHRIIEGGEANSIRNIASAEETLVIITIFLLHCKSECGSRGHRRCARSRRQRARGCRAQHRQQRRPQRRGGGGGCRRGACANLGANSIAAIKKRVSKPRRDGHGRCHRRCEGRRDAHLCAPIRHRSEHFGVAEAAGDRLRVELVMVRRGAADERLINVIGGDEALRCGNGPPQATTAAAVVTCFLRASHHLRLLLLISCILFGGGGASASSLTARLAAAEGVGEL